MPCPAAANRVASAFLTVQEGCDKFCTYCVVPYTRGAEISRPYSDLIDEAQRLLEAGAKEITLLGQNVNAWSGEDGKGRAVGLDGLIRALADMPGLARIRYTTSHPADMTDGLIAAHGEVDKLMPFLHLPVQSGSDRVLKAMNRSHTAEGYLRLLERVRAVRPDIALSGDFIVGFPGESDADFEDTLRLVEQVGYAQCFSFKYSPRPGTPAATMDDQIAPEVMDERLQRLQAALQQGSLAFNQSTVGRHCQVLIERKGKLPGQWLGKSPWLQSVHFTGDFAIGDLVRVELAEAGPNSLSGRLLHSGARLRRIPQRRGQCRLFVTLTGISSLAWPDQRARIERSACPASQIAPATWRSSAPKPGTKPRATVPAPSWSLTSPPFLAPCSASSTPIWC